MGFLKNIFGNKKDEPIKSYSDFWAWFQENEKEFFAVVKNKKEIEKGFFNQLSQKLNELKEGYFYLTGMFDDNTVELVLTADGNTKNIVFVEELVNIAPQINGWRFTALKYSSNIQDVNINMDGYKFNSENLSFYSNSFEEYPDEIDITIVYNNFIEENKEQIINGTSIFLENFLGELDFVNNIDSLKVIGIKNAKKELIPIEKIKDFLTWRQKEFIEKYEGLHYDTENVTYSLLEAEFDSGDTLFAVINPDLLKWDCKASHPWISVLTIKYGGENTNGMPSKKDFKLLDKIEDDLIQELKDIDGHLNIGRQTAKGEREIYFACKDFRKISKVFFKAQQNYSQIYEIQYDIYKDKYWQSFERFNH